MCIFATSSLYLLFLLGHTISVLYCAHLCMKCSLGISNFLEEFSSLSHSTVFLHFFAFSSKGFFYLSMLFFGTLHSDGYIFSFLLYLSFIFFSQLFVRPPQTTILPFLQFFFLGMVLILASCTMLWTSLHSSSDTLSIRFNTLSLFVTSTVQSKGFDLGHT